MPLPLILADGTGMDLLMPLINVGGIGVVLAWVLWKIEPRLRSMESTIDRNSRAEMIGVLAMSYVPDALKDQARSIIVEVDEAERLRKGK